jgi:mannose-6-phosphate isomerase-like protein (cupin superfamily)
MDIRRVVTGTTPSGAAVVSDERVAPITVGLIPGGEFHAIWGSDTRPSLPTDGQKPDAKGWFPPAGGFRFGLVTLGPDSVELPSDFDLFAGIAELAQNLPGMAEVIEPDQPGMHTTDTVDYVVILSGEVWLELDNGRQHLVRAGDVIVQNGTRHAWRNKTNQPCTMAVALLGAPRGG